MKREGIYYIKLKKPYFDLSKGDLLYIGKGNDVDSRLKAELGLKSSHATFFRSLGLLLNKEVAENSGKKGTGYNFKFKKPHEIVKWIEEYVEHEVKYCKWREVEEKEIRKHKPLLNIVYNTQDCHSELTSLRKQAHEIAKK
ncbi:GIY-YIG nuclease family protein [Microbulbifer sp. EKSA005]|uniref:GIY-YIG nuclease family protein n=1 Tax=Microbulbifer sp. EKSA005 TaxID=3243364 RepID=UPI00404138F7